MKRKRIAEEINKNNLKKKSVMFKNIRKYLGDILVHCIGLC